MISRTPVIRSHARALHREPTRAKREQSHCFPVTFMIIGASRSCPEREAAHRYQCRHATCDRTLHQCSRWAHASTQATADCAWKTVRKPQRSRVPTPAGSNPVGYTPTREPSLIARFSGAPRRQPNARSRRPASFGNRGVGGSCATQFNASCSNLARHHPGDVRDPNIPGATRGAVGRRPPDLRRS